MFPLTSIKCSSGLLDVVDGDAKWAGFLRMRPANHTFYQDRLVWVEPKSHLHQGWISRGREGCPLPPSPPMAK